MAQSFDERVYSDWTGPLVERIYGPTLNLHLELYSLSHRHRVEHGEQRCTVWPSPPARAPLWHLLARLLGARRFLEIGCGLGYTAALMADAGGEGCHVDAIESVPSHADLAERQLSRLGSGRRVRVLREGVRTGPAHSRRPLRRGLR